MKAILTVLFSAIISISSGQQWKNYLMSQTINCFATDHDTIWVGTQGGVAKYLIDGTKLANYTHADGLAANDVIAIAIDSQDNKWFSTDYGGLYPSTGAKGVSKFDGNTWTTYYTTNNGFSLDWNNSIAVDTNGNVWVGGYGISKYDGNTWTNYNTGNSGIPSLGVLSLTLDKKGNLWMLGEYANQLVKYDGTTWTIMTIDSNIPSGIITSMVFDQQNNLWIVYVQDGPHSYPGVVKFDGSVWTYYNTVYASSMAIDSRNHKWFSGSGLLEFNDTTWTEHSGPGTGALCIDHQDNKWFGEITGNSSDTLGKYDGSNWTLYNPSQSGMPGNYVSALAADHHGNIWMGTGNPTAAGVVKFDGVNWSGYPSLSGAGWNATVSCIAADKTGNIWMGGTYGGVYEYDGANWQTFNPTSLDYGIICVAVDSLNNKWFCTQGGGLLNLTV